jgi:hypothetical protein
MSTESTIEVRILVAVHAKGGKVNYDAHGWARDGKQAPDDDVRGLVDECVDLGSTVRYTWVTATVKRPEVEDVDGKAVDQ